MQYHEHPSGGYTVTIPATRLADAIGADQSVIYLEQPIAKQGDLLHMCVIDSDIPAENGQPIIVKREYMKVITPSRELADGFHQYFVLRGMEDTQPHPWARGVAVANYGQRSEGS